MGRLIILGNCVAQKLGQLLQGLIGWVNQYGDHKISWEVYAPPALYNLSKARIQEIAAQAEKCDLVFSQPLFNYDACNTKILRQKMGARLHLFSAPNFEAYFPDVLDVSIRPAREQFAPPLEWHSRIIAQCKAANVPVAEVENIYLHNPLFQKASILRHLDYSWKVYERRETGVDIDTLETVRRYYDKEPLFHTWNHPGDRLLRVLLTGFIEIMGEDPASLLPHIPWKETGSDPNSWSDWGFGFNAWPIINSRHDLFSFPGRPFFRIAGKQIDILTASIAWYNYYDAHPDVLDRVIAHSQKTRT